MAKAIALATWLLIWYNYSTKVSTCRTLHTQLILYEIFVDIRAIELQLIIHCTQSLAQCTWLCICLPVKGEKFTAQNHYSELNCFSSIILASHRVLALCDPLQGLYHLFTFLWNFFMNRFPSICPPTTLYLLSSLVELTWCYLLSSPDATYLGPAVVKALK